MTKGTSMSLSRGLVPAGVLLAAALVAMPGPGGIAPARAASTALQLPPVRKVTLHNGLTVLVMPTHRVPIVDFRLVVRAGSVNDPAGKEGLANLTADLLTQGAGKRTARQLAEAIAFVGGTLEANAGTEQLTVTCDVLTKDYASGLELFRDVIVAPTFAAEEFARIKAETLGQIASEKDDPSELADNELGSFLLGGSPLGHPVIGRQASVGKIVRADVVAFQKRYVTPGNSLLAVVGDVDPDQVVASLESAFAGWKGGAAAAAGPAYGAPEAVTGRKVMIVSKPEVTQTQIRLATLGVPRNSPDYYAITVANTILGGGFTSRLVNEIRVVQGLTYGIGSRWSMYRNAGTFEIVTFTRNETLRKCIDASLAVVQKLVNEGPSEAELAKARRYLTGQFPLGLQASDALATQILNIEFYGLDPRFIETYSERINAVTMADVKRVLKQRFGVNDLRILVVSDPKTAGPALESLGPATVLASP
jgi:zinc protease